MTAEVIELVTQETVVIESPGPGETLVLERVELELVEVAEQGQPGPPPTFDIDLALIYQTAKL